MYAIHDNLGSLPANAQELALAVRKDEQLSNLWSSVTIFHCVMLSNIH